MKKTRMSLSKKPEMEVRWDLIRSYALAQYHMGIEQTLEIKREICGFDALIETPMHKLRKLVRVLRNTYKKEGHKMKKKNVLPNDPKGEGTLKEVSNE